MTVAVCRKCTQDLAAFASSEWSSGSARCSSANTSSSAAWHRNSSTDSPSRNGAHFPRRSFAQTQDGSKASDTRLSGLLSVQALPNPQRFSCPLSNQSYRLAPFPKPRVEKASAAISHAKDLRAKGLAVLKNSSSGTLQQEDCDSLSAFEISLVSNFQPNPCASILT
jgi:hypothetical protein